MNRSDHNTMHLSAGTNIRVGTRGSDLALTQTGLVVDALKAANPRVGFEIVIIKTRGDLDQRQHISPLGVGIFVKELEVALLDRRIDIAVHSLKDMPSSLPLGFTLAAVPSRGDPRDALISRDGMTLEQLPAGSRVATGSPRRQALIKNLRPDLVVEPQRGNVPRRLQKLEEPDGPDAVILAAAGLKRLGLQKRITQYLPCMTFIAAVGQGALAVETRTDDTETTKLAEKLDHRNTRLAVTAERSFLETVRGGCTASVSAHARVTDDNIKVSAFASTPDGSEILTGSVTGNATDAQKLGTGLGESLVQQGARKLLARRSD